jgi:hypothetical protein
MDNPINAHQIKDYKRCLARPKSVFLFIIGCLVSHNYTQTIIADYTTAFPKKGD